MRYLDDIQQYTREKKWSRWHYLGVFLGLPVFAAVLFILIALWQTSEPPIIKTESYSSGVLGKWVDADGQSDFYCYSDGSFGGMVVKATNEKNNMTWWNTYDKSNGDVLGSFIDEPSAKAYMERLASKEKKCDR